MIQANDLRIGNLVLGGSKIIVICTLSMEDIIWACSEECQPISLTSEILENSGFECNTKGFYYRNDLPVFIKPTGVNWLVKTRMHEPLTSANYVHTLQNLYYSLTGEELTINL